MRSEREPFTNGENGFVSPRIDSEYTRQVAEDTDGDTRIINMYNGATDTTEPTAQDTEVSDGLDVPDTADCKQTDVAVLDGQEGIGLTDGNQTDGRYVDGIFVPSEYTVTDSVTEVADDVVKTETVIDQLPEGIEIVNGIAYIREDVPDRVQVVVRIDREFKRRLTVISNLERRTMTVVVEEAVRRFMSEPINEPRPYLPPELCGEQDGRLAFYLSSEDKYFLEARARSECRSVNDIVRRALADYVGSSPYDPLRYMKGVMSSETVQNRPTIEEQAKEVSEYLQPSEVRLTPSEAQKTGDVPSEGVTE